MERLTCWTPLVVLAVLLCHLQMSTACSCRYKQPQTKFCEADYVALVTVEEVTTVSDTPYTIAYKVHVNETLKATPSAQVALEQKPVWIRTRSNSGICGLAGLSPGDTWVLGGNIDIGHLYVWSCGLAMRWAAATPDQLVNLRQSYQKGCA